LHLTHLRFWLLRIEKRKVRGLMTLTSVSLPPPLLAEDAEGCAIQAALDAPKRDIRPLQKLGTNPFHFDPHDAVGQGLLRGFQRTAGRAYCRQKQRRRQPVGHVPRPVVLQRARPHSVHRQRKVCSRCTVRLISEPAEIIRQACVHLALPTVRILSQQSLLFGQLPEKGVAPLDATDDLFRAHRGSPPDQPPQIGPFVVRLGQSGQEGGRIEGVTRLPALDDGDAPHQATVEAQAGELVEIIEIALPAARVAARTFSLMIPCASSVSGSGSRMPSHLK
jgi:hypothetical protein